MSYFGLKVHEDEDEGCNLSFQSGAAERIWLQDKGRYGYHC